MAREYRVISALAGTKVPVPATYLLCTDPAVIGAPFYVMEKVAGTAYRSAAQLETIGAARTRAIATRMIGTLADLHAVDPGAVGLADFGRPQGFLGRQVRRWKKQLDASRSRDLPGADELYEALEARIPAESDVAIVHGDYRLDNLLIGDDDRVTAVLDWEMATLGDPLADVALLLAYQALAHLETGYAVADAATAPGFPDAEEITASYAELSGRDLSNLGFHLGLGYFKIAVICEGIYYRYYARPDPRRGIRRHRRRPWTPDPGRAGHYSRRSTPDGFPLRRHHREAARQPARLHGREDLPGRAGLRRPAGLAQRPLGLDAASHPRRTAGRGPRARPVEPVPAGRARRRAHQPAVRAAGRDHRAQPGPGPGRAELRRARHRQHGSAGHVRHPTSSARRGSSRCWTARSARPSR